MAENTAIEWTDHTFNPWIGCTKVSPGCDHCYAEAMMGQRLQRVQWGPSAVRSRTSVHNWRSPRAWNANHEQFFAAHGRRQRVFCASLADVFDNAVDPAWRADLLDLIDQTANLDWLLLTKRIGNVGSMMPNGWLVSHSNVWLGASIVNQVEADRDIPKLAALHAHVKFLSMEPLLGPVRLDQNLPEERALRWHRPMISMLDWVIVGGESGPSARPMSIQWARELRDQCAAANIPFLFKQWGEWAPAGAKAPGTPGRFAFGDYENERDHFAQTDAYPRAFDRFGARCVLERQGKKIAGRLLDGVQHDGFPQHRL